MERIELDKDLGNIREYFFSELLREISKGWSEIERAERAAGEQGKATVIRMVKAGASDCAIQSAIDDMENGQSQLC